MNALREAADARHGGRSGLVFINLGSLHFDAGREFVAADDRLHDIRMMKHHLKCHRRTIWDIGRDR